MGKMIKKTTNRPPRAKRESDKNYNVRRRLKRRAASLRKDGRIREAQHLEEQAAQTYAVRVKGENKRTRLEYVKSKIAEAKATLSAFLRSEEKRKFELSNETRQAPSPRQREKKQTPRRDNSLSNILAQIDASLEKQTQPEIDLNSLTPVENEKRGALTTEERAVLYGALRDEWLGVPREYRQDLLLKKYGVESEEELFSLLEDRLLQYEKKREAWEIPLEEKYKLFAAI